MTSSPLIPYLRAAFLCSHCLLLQQVASDIKGIFEHTNKLLVLYCISNGTRTNVSDLSRGMRNNVKIIVCLSDVTD